MGRKNLSKEEREARWDLIAAEMTNPKDRKRYEVVLKTEKQQKSWTEKAAKQSEKRANTRKRINSPEHKQQINEWQRENTKAYQLRLTRSSGLINVLDNIEKQTGTKPATYIRQALLEKLARDGYMPDSNKTE